MKNSSFRQEKNNSRIKLKKRPCISLDHPDTKNLWEKSLKYNINVDSSHPTDTSSIKVPILRVALWNYYSFREENSRKFDISRTGIHY